MESLHSMGSEKPEPRIKVLLRWILAVLLLLGVVAFIETQYYAG